jgi:hypothetical protein
MLLPEEQSCARAPFQGFGKQGFRRGHKSKTDPHSIQPLRTDKESLRPNGLHEQ